MSLNPTHARVAGLDEVLTTGELELRSSRPPDHEAENRALQALAQELATSPRTLLQKLVETVLDVCRADSAGISIYVPDEGLGSFRWDAAAGQLAHSVGGSMPRDESPCGVVMDEDSVLLFDRPHRHFTALAGVEPPIVENLLVPFHVAGRPVGTLWAISHTPERRFDAEDARLLTSLSRFASAGYQLDQALDATAAAHDRLEERVQERTRELAERKRAETALRESEATFRHLVQRSPFGVYVVDADFRLRLVSAGSQKVFRNVHPLIGRDFAEVLRAIWTEPFASEAIACFRQTLETGEPYHAPSTTEHRQDVDDVESYDWKIERITLPDGQLGVVCHFYDLTERAQAEAALREAKAAAERASAVKSQFLSTMSHELRTPLTAVIGLSDLLGTEVVGPMNEKQRDYLSRIQSSAWHLVTIIDEILTFTRSEAGKEEVHAEKVDVAGIAREVVGMLAGEAQARGLALALAGAEARAIAVTDGGKVRQVLTNLVGNALKYTDAGAVDVALEAGAEWLELRVRDTGPGIAPERLEEIFEPFVQVDGSATREKGGTGLGLTIARRLARLLGGDVGVESTPGAGSTFTLRLPRRTGAAA